MEPELAKKQTSPMSSRSFAIVPAAGSSRRMGQPKLLLEWRHSTVIETVLGAWRASRIEVVVAVVRADHTELIERCRAAGAIVAVQAVPPPEMRDSVRAGLDYVDQHFAPQARDVWLLAPADMPGITPAAIDALLDAHDPEAPSILVPVVHGRRGHPVLFPWPLREDVRNLGADEGVNALLARRRVREVAIPEPGLIDDLDTPADYLRRQQP